MIEILPCMHFYFKSIRISFIGKVTRVDKVMIVVNNTSLRGAILVLFLEFCPGYWAEIPIRTDDKIHPSYRAHMKRPLIRNSFFFLFYRVFNLVQGNILKYLRKKIIIKVINSAIFFKLNCTNVEPFPFYISYTHVY